MTASERITGTPLATDVRGSSVRVVVAADKYTVANINAGMNDREEYARLFAASPQLLAAVDRAADILGAWLTDNTETAFEDQPELDEVRASLLDVAMLARFGAPQ